MAWRYNVLYHSMLLDPVTQVRWGVFHSWHHVQKFWILEHIEFWLRDVQSMQFLLSANCESLSKSYITLQDTLFYHSKSYLALKTSIKWPRNFSFSAGRSFHGHLPSVKWSLPPFASLCLFLQLCSQVSAACSELRSRVKLARWIQDIFLGHGISRPDV